MRKSKSHLVSQHMEGISAKALEQYQDIIREYIRGRHGIYALYKREKLYYVGLEDHRCSFKYEMQLQGTQTELVETITNTFLRFVCIFESLTRRENNA